MTTVMDRRYSSEELSDIERDVYEYLGCFDNGLYDEHGFHTGTFRVHITWEAETE